MNHYTYRVLSFVSTEVSSISSNKIARQANDRCLWKVRRCGFSFLFPSFFLKKRMWIEGERLSPWKMYQLNPQSDYCFEKKTFFMVNILYIQIRNTWWVTSKWWIFVEETLWRSVGYLYHSDYKISL